MSEPKPDPTMPAKCPQCGAALPAGALEGLCPACLLRQGVAETRTQGDAGASSFQPPTVAEVARMFPQLEVRSFIGKGGMGAVYRARQPALDRLVAIKILPARPGGDTTFVERFNREARALAKLNHPNIVTLYEFGQAEGSPYFIMEYVDGLNLRHLEKAGRLTAREALQIVPQICEALQFAHDEGIVHRDIKPENILLDKKGRVKIADFGIAKILGREEGKVPIAETNQAIGTPQYMAPEQVAEPQSVDHRADIYSLGVVFYEMLTGELPEGNFRPPSKHAVQVDVRLDEVVLRALEQKPELRYQQASEVKTVVETIAVRQALNQAGAAKVRSEPSGYARLALGLWLTAVLGTVLLIGILSNDDWALIFGGVALVLATVFGGLSWKERMGRGVVMATAGLVVVLGVAAWLLAFWGALLHSRDKVRLEAEAAERRRAFADGAASRGWAGDSASSWNADTATEELRLRVKVAEAELGRAQELFNTGKGTRLEVVRATAQRDVAAAELRNDPREAAQLKMKLAEAELEMQVQLFNAGRVSAAEIRKAEAARDLAAAKLQSVAEAGRAKARTPAPAVQPWPAPGPPSPPAGRTGPAHPTAEPQLRFLAWQDAKRSEVPPQLWHADGSLVTNAAELNWVRQMSPGGMDVSATEAGKRDPHFLHLWFSHPDFDRHSLVDLKLLDGKGKAIPLGADGSMAGSSHGTDERVDGAVWLSQTLSPGEGAQVPSRLTVQLNYVLGPLERVQKVDADFQGSMSLEGSSQLSGTGQTAAGRSFLAVAIDTRKLAGRRFDVVAVTKDGRELEAKGVARGGTAGAGVSVAKFEFDEPLAKILHFRVGTRAVRTHVWKDVPLVKKAM